MYQESPSALCRSDASPSAKFHPHRALQESGELRKPLSLVEQSLRVRCGAIAWRLRADRTSPGGGVLTEPRIHSFLALCEHGTTTAAAAATHRALSTISTHVGAIEARVGAALFKRAHGVFILTDLGEEVRRHAETIVAAEAAIMAITAHVTHRGPAPEHRLT